MQDHRYSQPQSDKDTDNQLHTASQQDNSNQTLSLFLLGKGNLWAARGRQMIFLVAKGHPKVNEWPHTLIREFDISTQEI